jgi:hypothetical protein
MTPVTHAEFDAVCACHHARREAGRFPLSMRGGAAGRVEP